MNKTKIMKRLQSDYEYVKGYGYTVLGVFLHGSQNYHLDYEGSDIDTKAILIPSFKDFVLNRKPVSTTLVLPSGEHIDIKDIRLYMDCFKKQNINFIEILFTEYKIINPEYEYLYKPMLDNAEIIAHYNNYQTVYVIFGNMHENHKRLYNVDEENKHGYNKKTLSQMLRYEEFLTRFTEGIPYKECFIPTNTEYLIQVKSEYMYTLEEVRKMAQMIENRASNTKSEYLTNNPIRVDKRAEDIMNKVLYDVFKYKFSTELLEE